MIVPWLLSVPLKPALFPSEVSTAMKPVSVSVPAVAVRSPPPIQLKKPLAKSNVAPPVPISRLSLFSTNCPLPEPV